MEVPERHIVISHLIKRFPGKLIAKQRGIALDECMHLLFFQQIVGNAFNFLGRTSMQRGDGG